MSSLVNLILAVLLVAGGFVSDMHVSAQNARVSSGAIADFLRREIQLGHVVGAQTLVGSPQTETQQPLCLGTIGPQDPRPVTGETVFCIASSSKPLASALIFTLVDRRQMRGDQTAGELIPAMKSMMTAGGLPARGPTVRELLTHRGGIYSQKNRMTQAKVKAIRDFTLSLEESAAIIASQPLASVPGTDYAYSGAGYCLLGAMAEKATGKSIEQLLQENLCKPLKMDSTTYFPNQEDFQEIAIGGANGGQIPHLLGTQLKLALVGGSLYTNAGDMERFAKMVVMNGSLDSTQVLSKMAHSHFVSQPFPAQPYGYGWSLTKQNGRVVAVSHMGSLPPYQSMIRVNLQKKTYAIVLWTLANPNDRASMTQIKNGIATLVNQMQ